MEPQFVRLDETRAFELVAGVTGKPLFGAGDDRSRPLRARLTVPAHSHPHEQLGIVLEGMQALVVGGVAHELEPFEAYVLPGGIEHSAYCGPDGALVLDVFTPCARGLPRALARRVESVTPNPARLALLLACSTLLVAAAVASVTSDSDEIALGAVYSTDAGDPIDLVAGPGEIPDTICANVGGTFYGSSITCFGTEEPRGSYQVVLPTKADRPALVVGLMPPGAHSATVFGVGRNASQAEPRGRWFLAVVELAAPGPLNLAPTRVEFG